MQQLAPADFDTNVATATDQTFEEIARADSKASLLLTVDGILAASLTGLGALGHPGIVATVLVAVGAAGLVAAMLTGLHVVRPRLAPRGVPADRASFVYWAHRDITMNDVAASLSEDRRVPRLRTLSVIALRKMRSLYWSATCTAVATVALATAAAITAA